MCAWFGPMIRTGTPTTPEGRRLFFLPRAGEDPKLMIAGNYVWKNELLAGKNYAKQQQTPHKHWNWLAPGLDKWKWINKVRTDSHTHTDINNTFYMHNLTQLGWHLGWGQHDKQLSLCSGSSPTMSDDEWCIKWWCCCCPRTVFHAQSRTEFSICVERCLHFFLSFCKSMQMTSLDSTNCWICARKMESAAKNFWSDDFEYV